MRKRTKIALRVTAVLVVLLGIAGGALWLRLQPDAQGRVVPLFESIDMSALPKFADGVRSATSIQLFEGRLHPPGEDDTFKSHWHYFYSRPIIPVGDDGETLRANALNISSFHEWRGTKFCGGYHPDWMIRWTSADGDVHELHLCFGCHEAKLYGPDYQLYCDVRTDAYDTFKATLKRYHIRRF